MGFFTKIITRVQKRYQRQRRRRAVIKQRKGLGSLGVDSSRKKTGSRRRNVIKEDLVAEEDEALEAVSSTCGPVSRVNGDRRGLASGSNGC